LLRPIKKLAVVLGVIPKTMTGKRFLKRLVFGRLVTMPADIDDADFFYTPPEPLDPAVPDRNYKVIYCVATLNPQPGEIERTRSASE